MSQKKRKPLWIKKTLTLTGVLILLSAVGALYLRFGPGLGILTVSRESSSQTLTVQSRDLERLYTAEAIWDLVFPHDFFPSQEEWNAFLTKDRMNMPLTPEEWEWDRFHQLCREAGFLPAPGGTKFFVLRVIVKAGFDLSSPLAAKQQEAAPFLRREGESVVISPPPVQILDIRMEDPQRDHYPFPDTPLTPEQLRLITGYVSRAAEKRALDLGLLEEARRTGRDLLTRLLTDAGVEEIRFR